ncbi:MAG TPA: MBL fold metallo-hydrolase [Actinomycetota bacterium]|nr:MBL fold metallo-hydrolase [Actinomycetota bacterium]
MVEVRWTKTVGPAEITKLSVGRMDNNIYIVAVGNDAAVVDAGSNEPDSVLDALGDRRLSVILQTHNHGDHTTTLREIVDRTEAAVLAHPADALPVSADALDDGDVQQLGSVSFKVLHTPGHTPGSICFLLEEAGESHLFAGDTLFPGGPGNTFGNAAAFATIMESLDTKLFVLPDATNVYPGHGADTTIGTERPSVEEWRARGW